MQTVDTFDPDDIKVAVSTSEIKCLYNLSARLSLLEPNAIACATQGKIRAGLPSAGALDARLPEGFSRWRFNPRESQLVFDRYLRGRCRYGPKSYSEVSLFSAIPPGHLCEASAASVGGVACSEQQLLCGAGRVVMSRFGVQYCGACPEGAVSSGHQSECTVCGAGSAPNAAHDACEVCGAGQITQGGRCSLCATGSVPDEKRTSCVACDPDKISSGNSCVACSPGTLPNIERNACAVCGGNQALKGTQCLACSNGSVPNPEHTACELCGDHEIAVGASCSSCRAGTVPNAEHTACIACTGDQISEGDACVSCPGGTLPTEDHSYCYVAPKRPPN